MTDRKMCIGDLIHRVTYRYGVAWITHCSIEIEPLWGVLEVEIKNMPVETQTTCLMCVGAP